ncbi:MAG: hypothetical protein UX88_C0012G0023, partial [Candidatus Woesebacteria bacterium GW2011_GWC2_47_16]
LKIFGNFCRVKNDGGIEIGKAENQKEVKSIIDQRLGIKGRGNSCRQIGKPFVVYSSQKLADNRGQELSRKGRNELRGEAPRPTRRA